MYLLDSLTSDLMNLSLSDPDKIQIIKEISSKFNFSSVFLEVSQFLELK
jgi:hypothetical protein